MRINSVSKINKNEYPTESEISENKVKHSIPEKWRKLGISAFVFEIIMQISAKKVIYAEEDIDMTVYSGSVTSEYPRVMNNISLIARLANIIFLVGFIASLVILIKKNKKAKKENKKVKGKVIFMILSIVSGVLAILAALVYGYVRLFLA